MHTSTTHSNALSKAAERQMRNWVLDLQTQRRLTEERKRTKLQDLIHPFIFISRETGVDATEIAQAVADKCGWKMLDRGLLDYLAEHEHFSRLRSTSWTSEPSHGSMKCSANGSTSNSYRKPNT